MTFDEFRIDFMDFLSSANVNLGRLNSKTRERFLEQANGKFEELVASLEEPSEEPKTTENLKGRVLCIKPTDSRRALDIGKGVKGMTASESARADEQLNRSPFQKRTKGKKNA